MGIHAHVFHHRCCFQEGTAAIEILCPCDKGILIKKFRIARHISASQASAIFNKPKIVKVKVVGIAMLIPIEIHDVEGVVRKFDRIVP